MFRTEENEGSKEWAWKLPKLRNLRAPCFLCSLLFKPLSQTSEPRGHSTRSGANKGSEERFEQKKTKAAKNGPWKLPKLRNLRAPLFPLLPSV
jgi:hypothetical protein